MSDQIDLKLVAAPTAEVRELVALLEAELAESYPPEQRHGLKVEAIFQPYIRFYVAWLDGEAVGCGGVALYDGFAELKRMYVRPEARGKGVAKALIVMLEFEAASAGLTLVRLETGTEQVAAIRLYARCGYAESATFEPYASMPPHKTCTSVFFEKTLSS